jgi:hypothetical protein
MKKWISVVLLATAALVVGIVVEGGYWTRLGVLVDVPFWQRQISPGPLSPSHASLESNCAACHTPVQSADSTKCIGCHVNNASLLQRQPTAFHAIIGACSRCHLEHQGVSPRPLPMDHVALADIGLEGVRRNADNPSNSRLLAWIRQHETGRETVPMHPEVKSSEAALDCASCHSTKDRHQGYFGGDCASCHRTAAWTIAEFQHPSLRSVECAECHKPPPSHYMMHFEMVSKRVASPANAPGNPCCANVTVNQCYRCHQTTSWNDIKGVGWYKHH